MTVSGTSLSQGADLVINTAATSSLSLTKLTNSEAIVCYKDEGSSNHGTCNHLTVSGTSLIKGADLVFNGASTADIAVVRLTNAKAAVAYVDKGNSEITGPAKG